MDLLVKFCVEGPPIDQPEQAVDQCIFIAPRKHKGKVRTRHRGEDPALVWAGLGRCPVRARVLYPVQVADPSRIRVILLLHGEHNHVYPICKPPMRAIAGAVEQQPDASTRVLQVSDTSIRSHTRCLFFPW